MDAIIQNSAYAVEGDQSAETPTKLYRILTFACRNRQCESFGKAVGQRKLELTIGENSPSG
jgi:hypothetical protein